MLLCHPFRFCVFALPLIPSFTPPYSSLSPSPPQLPLTSRFHYQLFNLPFLPSPPYVLAPPPNLFPLLLPSLTHASVTLLKSHSCSSTHPFPPPHSSFLLSSHPSLSRSFFRLPALRPDEEALVEAVLQRADEVDGGEDNPFEMAGTLTAEGPEGGWQGPGGGSRPSSALGKGAGAEAAGEWAGNNTRVSQVG